MHFIGQSKGRRFSDGSNDEGTRDESDCGLVGTREQRTGDGAER